MSRCGSFWRCVLRRRGWPGKRLPEQVRERAPLVFRRARVAGRGEVHVAAGLPVVLGPWGGAGAIRVAGLCKAGPVRLDYCREGPVGLLEFARLAAGWQQVPKHVGKLARVRGPGMRGYRPVKLVFPSGVSARAVPFTLDHGGTPEHVAAPLVLRVAVEGVRLGLVRVPGEPIEGQGPG